MLQLITPKILGRFTDAIKTGSLTPSDLVYFPGLILGLAVTIAVFRFFWRFYIVGTSRKLEYYLRSRLYQHIQTLAPAFFDQHNPGDLMALSTNDIHAVRMALGVGLIMFVDGIVLVCAAIVVMSDTIHLPLTLAVLTPLPFIIIFAIRFGKQVHQRFRTVQEAFAALTDSVQENIAGSRVIKGYVQERNFLDRFTAVNKSAVEKNLELARFQSLFVPLTHALPSVCFFITLLYGGRLVIQGEISLGDLVAFYGYLGLIIWPVMGFGLLVNFMQRGAASMDRINQILLIQPAIEDCAQPADIDFLQGHITIQNLSFRYHGAASLVLENISLDIPSGTTVGIIGKTGSGKTTLVQLLLRLYEAPAQTIKFDSINIQDISLTVLRSNIGYVPQDTALFSTSLRENIAFDQTYPDTAIWEAARIAHIDKEINALPKQLDTLIGERGITLSGGQKQRVALARAIIKNPAVLILDDSFSAVDSQTQAAILQDLRAFRQNRTTIIISHRISTLLDADQIIVLDEGRLAEQGTHAQLITIEGIYKRMYRQQLLLEEIDATEGAGEHVF
jgi:ATP-binding cassette subfamily B protein